MELAIESNRDESADLWTEISFQMPYARYAADFLRQMLPPLRDLGPGDSVRLILSFDS